jgi:hypothetical protein
MLSCWKDGNRYYARYGDEDVLNHECPLHVCWKVLKVAAEKMKRKECV